MNRLTNYRSEQKEVSLGYGGSGETDESSVHNHQSWIKNHQWKIPTIKVKLLLAKRFRKIYKAFLHEKTPKSKK